MLYIQGNKYNFFTCLAPTIQFVSLTDKKSWTFLWTIIIKLCADYADCYQIIKPIDWILKL